MHPDVAAKGADGKEAFGMVGGDFGLVFAYTKSPPLPIGADGREPTCEGWQTAGEDDDAAYLARAGWPYHYLSQGLQAMGEVCSKLEARGLIPALSALLCVSAPDEAENAGRLSGAQRVEVLRGLQCGEHGKPQQTEQKERQEAQTKEAENKEEEAKEQREQAKGHEEIEAGAKKQEEEPNPCEHNPSREGCH
ncbi:MAG: hypothetical protein ACLQQB_03290 [Solirubrobacteraceae bacterium]